MEIKSNIGIAWYHRDQWSLFREFAGEKDFARADFDEWLIDATTYYERLTKSGYFVQKIEVDLDDLMAWCKSKGCKPDANSRSEYLWMKLMGETANIDGSDQSLHAENSTPA